MIFIDVTGEIVNGNYAAFMGKWLGEDEKMFCLDTVKEAIEDAQDDPDVCFNLNSFGGDVQEAFDIYDYVRSLTGKNIYANIIGESSSAASVILLSAAKKNRSGNAHCYATLHFTSGAAYGKVEDIEKQAELMRKYNEMLVDIYVERTGMSRSRASAMMEQDVRHTATELLSMGFISSINAHTTASSYAFAMQDSIYQTRIAAMAKQYSIPGVKPEPEPETTVSSLLNIFK
jgi:ATP-dependent protease ClpP protease subunit